MRDAVGEQTLALGKLDVVVIEGRQQIDHQGGQAVSGGIRQQLHHLVAGEGTREADARERAGQVSSIAPGSARHTQGCTDLNPG